MKKYFYFFLKLSFSALLVAFVLSKINFSGFLSALNQADLPWLCAAFLIFLATLVLAAIKWRVLLKAFDLAIPVWDLFKLNLTSSFYASILPGGQLLGETVKSFRLVKGQEKKFELVASVFMDRLTGFAASIWLALFGVMFTSSQFQDKTKIIWLFSILSFFCLGLFALASNKLSIILQQSINKFSSSIKLDVTDKIVRLAATFFCFRGKVGILLKALGLSIFFQLLCTVCVFVLSHSLDVKVTLLDFFWVNSIVSLIVFIPVSIMGIGLREGGFVFLLALLGVFPEKATAISFLNFVFILTAALLGGFFEFKIWFRPKTANAEPGK